MNARKEVRFRGSRLTAAVGFMAIAFILFTGVVSLWNGGFRVPAFIFLFFIAGCSLTIVYTLFAEVRLSEEGISQKTLFSRWRFRWDEIDNWTVEAKPNDSDSLWFRAGSLPAGCTISGAAVDERQLREVKEWFRKFAGEPIPYEKFIAQFGGPQR